MSSLALWSSRSYVGLEQITRQTDEVRLSLAQLLSFLKDAETGQRGFLLTGEARYLRPYNSAPEAIDQELRRLSTLLRETPEQRKDLAHLQLLIARKFDETTNTIQVRQQKGLQAVLPLILNGEGLDIMREIREVVGRMEASAEAERSEHVARQAQFAKAMMFCFFVGTALTLVLLVSAQTIVTMNIAERDRAYGELSRLNVQLEERVAQRTAALDESNRALQQFAYMASHDLQEPLRMVSGYVKLLARRYQGKLDEDADEFIQFALDGTDRMRQMITNLLQLSRIDGESVQKELVDPNQICQEVLETLHSYLTERQADVSCDSLPLVIANPAQVHQLLQNLISNGVKFQADAKPHVHVSASAAREEVTFSVRDNGIGISPENQERIFAMFQRLHARDQYAGTGIGLAVCRRIVEANGGRIWVHSQQGQGSTFQFTLPAGNASSTTEPRAMTAKGG